MAKFFYRKFQWVTVVISEKDYESYRVIRQSDGDPSKTSVRLFTFCDSFRARHELWPRVVMTGFEEQLHAMIQAGGHELVEARADLKVPFIDGYERGSQGSDLQLRELRYVTTLEEVAKAFGPESLAALCYIYPPEQSEG